MTYSVGALKSAVSLGDFAGGTGSTVAAMSDVSTAAHATAALSLVNSSTSPLGNQNADWGTGASRRDTHKRFVDKLHDALNSDVGSLSDAELAEESAKLQCLQVKQQLSIEALSIANSSAQSALLLFR